MKANHFHAIVLGAGLLLASVILLVRVSSASRRAETGDARATTPAVEKPSARKTVPDDTESGDDKSLREAEGLVNEAHELFQLAYGKEGREGELLQAKGLLRKAQDLLEPLPRDDPKVKALATRLSQVLDDVVRVSGL